MHSLPGALCLSPDLRTCLVYLFGAGFMSPGSITNLLSDVPRPTDLGAGQILLQSRGPGELFFGENLARQCPIQI